MFTKKVILPVAALAMTALVGCGDDSSSSGPSYDVAPASVKTFMDIDKIPCSPTQNLCAKVLTEDYNDYYQCNGTQWNMMIMGQDTPVKGCENAAPAAETPADPAAETPADPAAETPADPAAETPADPAAETPADPAGPGAETPVAGDVIYCIVPGVMGGCEALPAAMKDQCETLLEGQLVDACPAE